MISAVLLLSAVSASFIGIGIAYKRVPGTMKGEDVMFWYSLFSLVLLLPAEFYSGSVSAIPIPWIICLLLIGNFNIFGMLLLQTAMKRGNSGIAWALTQSALIGPFLFGMVFFGEKHSLFGITGLCLVLLGMICQIKDERKTPGAAPGRMYSLLLAFCAFLCCAVTQTALTISSYSAIPMSGTGKTFLLMLGAVAGLLIFKLSRRNTSFALSGKMAVTALLLSFLSLASTLLLFLALDKLAAFSLAGLAYPVSLGSSIAGFALYSACVEKEKLSYRQAAGIISIIAGIFLLGF